MEKKYPTPFQRRTLWKAITGIAILALALLLVILVWVTGSVLSYLQPVLLPVAVSGIIAYLLDPVVRWFQIKKRMSRLSSVLTVFGMFLVLISIMAMIVIPPIAKQIGDAVEDRENIGEKVADTMDTLGDIPWLQPVTAWAQAEHPSVTEQRAKLKAIAQQGKQTPPPSAEENATSPAAEEVVTAKKAESFGDSNLGHTLTENMGKILGSMWKFVGSSTSTIISTLGLLIGLAMTPIYLYYFLKETSAIKANWQDFVPLKASPFKTEVVETLQEINGYLISFFRGQVLVAFIDGMLVGIALWAFGLPYGLVIGVIMAVIGVIPFIGNIICLIPSCIIAFVHFSVAEHRSSLDWMLGENPWAYVGAVVAIFVVVQQINSLVTAPKIVGDSVGLHPMTVIFSMLFWSLLLGGFMGALLAVPLTAAVKVLFRRYIWEKKLNDNSSQKKGSKKETNEKPDDVESSEIPAEA